MRFLPEIGNSQLICWSNGALDLKTPAGHIFISDKNRDNLCVNICLSSLDKSILELQVFSDDSHLIEKGIIARNEVFKSSPYLKGSVQERSFFNIFLSNHLRNEGIWDLYISSDMEISEILLFNKGNLVFHDVVGFSTIEELCYLIAAVHKSFSQGKAKVSLELNSEIEPKVFDFCEKYFENTELLKSDIRDMCTGLDPTMLSFFNYSTIENYLKML